MNESVFRDEDLTTEKLADLIRSHRSILQLFLEFLFPNDSLVAKGAELPWQIETQHGFRNGRIDLLLHTPTIAIIIECKVDDSPKIFQLAKYHDYWSSNYTSHPMIFWLVRRRSGYIGRNDYLARELLWNELYDHFKASIGRLDEESARENVEGFCDYLRGSGILLTPSERSQRKPRHRGYDLKFAEDLLDCIAAKLDGFDTEVVPPMNEVPHRLFAGRFAWKAKFADRWIKRVVLRFKPVAAVAGGCTLSGAIGLYHIDHTKNPQWTLSQFSRCAEICYRRGMIVCRDGGKWRGRTNPVLRPPFVLSPPVKYSGADRLVPEAQLRVFTPPEIDDAVTEGIKVVSMMVSIVDEF